MLPSGRLAGTFSVIDDCYNIILLQIRIPFYHLFKTLFLLYLALPQTRGASYVYAVHLHPFIAKHEVEIDAALGRVREEVWRWVMLRVRTLWENVASGETLRGPVAGGGGGATLRSETQANARDIRAEAPALPAGPMQLAYTLWQTYGPTLTALLSSPSRPASPPLSPATSPNSHPPRALARDRAPPVQPIRPMTQAPSYTHTHAQPQDARPDEIGLRGTTSALDMHPDAMLLARRRALEAELSALPLPRGVDGDPMVSGVGSGGGTEMEGGRAEGAVPRPPSSTYLPASSSDERGKYEEIAKDEVEDEEGGDAPPSAGGGGSWTGWWWGGAPQGSGYERVKTE